MSLKTIMRPSTWRISHGNVFSATWAGAQGERRPAGSVPTPGPLAPGMSTEAELPIRAPGAGRWSLAVMLVDPHGGRVAGAPELSVEVSREG